MSIELLFCGELIERLCDLEGAERGGCDLQDTERGRPGTRWP